MKRRTLNDKALTAAEKSAKELGIPQESDEWNAYVCGFANGYEAGYRAGKKDGKAKAMKECGGKHDNSRI